jgi:hypothetical protein
MDEKQARQKQKLLLQKLYLHMLDPDNDFSVERRERLKKILEVNVAPLREYIQTYEPLNKMLMIDSAELAKRDCTPNKTPQDVALLVKGYKEKAKEKAKEIENEILNEINIGLFHVNCNVVKQMVIRKYNDISRVLINSLGVRVMQQAAVLIEKYQTILTKLTVQPHNPEELVQKKEFLGTVPRELEALNPELDDMKSTYDTLESFEHTFTDDEFKKYWSGYGWAKRILGECADVEANLTRYRKVFEEQLMASQEKFSRQLLDMTEQVNRLTRYVDFENVEEVYGETSKIASVLEDMKKKMRKFNLNEGLLGHEQTEYPELNTTTKKLEGYNLL